MLHATGTLDGLNALSDGLQATPYLVISFYDYGILMRRRVDGTGETEYPISPAQLATALSARLQFQTGLLTGSTLYVATEGIKKLVVEYRDPQRTALFLDGSDAPLTIPLPGLVMIRVTTANDNPRYGIYAVKRRPTSLDTTLYLAPLPNTDTNGVCWGSVQKVSPEALAGTDLAEDWRSFLGSVFTSHSVYGKSKSHRDDIRQKFLDLEKRGCRRYPTGDLVALDITLDVVLQRAQS